MMCSWCSWTSWVLHLEQQKELLCKQDVLDLSDFKEQQLMLKCMLHCGDSVSLVLGAGPCRDRCVLCRWAVGDV